MRIISFLALTYRLSPNNMCNSDLQRSRKIPCHSFPFRLTTFPSLRRRCLNQAYLAYLPLAHCSWAGGFGSGEFDLTNRADFDSRHQPHQIRLGEIFSFRFARQSTFAHHQNPAAHAHHSGQFG
jgi:hypothetical protein